MSAYENFLSLYRNSPAWSLLKARTAPAILDFLILTFKSSPVPTQSFHGTALALADYLQFQQPDLEEEPEAGATEEAEIQRASRLLDQWVSKGWLRKFPNNRGEDQLELTPDAEKAIAFVHGLETREFIGTESRFKDIFRRLREVVEGSLENPKIKIAELEARIKAAKSQIREIKATGKVDTLTDTQLKERVYDLGKAMRELLGDFREVEYNFKEITRQIYERQGEQSLNKGNLLGFALDRIDELKDNDQGRSFYAFWEFLISSDRQNELKSLTRDLLDLLQDRNLDLQDPIFKGFRQQLHGSGQKVFDSNQLLAEKLNRIISEQNLRERKRALRTMNEIRRLALEHGPPDGERRHFWKVEAEARIVLPMDRPLGSQPEPTLPTSKPTSTDPDPDNAEWDVLFDTFYVDREKLEANIRSLLSQRSQVSLLEVTRAYPIGQGLPELLTYYAIASGSGNHLIDRDEMVELVLNAENDKRINAPQVIFSK